jgi:Cytochrome C oxidase, cbb3-type, subunit III
MTIFLLKSLLSLLLFIIAAAAMYAMFEALGRSTPSLSVERLKRLHKIAGYLYVALFVFISYLCIGFVAASRNDPSPRAALHIVLALSIAALFLLKVMYVRFFRQFYSQAKTIGILIGILSFVLVGLTGGFYLVTSRFGRDLTVDKSVYYELKGPFLIVKEIERPGIMAIRTDRFSIERGRTLFVSKCAICHDPNSTRTIIGPGLKGILKRPTLPISGRPATPEDIRFQLRQPMGRMPSFAYLSEEQVEDLLAYLNTL